MGRCRRSAGGIFERVVPADLFDVEDIELQPRSVGDLRDIWLRITGAEFDGAKYDLTPFYRETIASWKSVGDPLSDQ